MEISAGHVDASVCASQDLASFHLDLDKYSRNPIAAVKRCALCQEQPVGRIKGATVEFVDGVIGVRGAIVITMVVGSVGNTRVVV